MQKWRIIPSNQTIIRLVCVCLLLVNILNVSGCSTSQLTTSSSKNSILPVSDSAQLPQAIKQLLQQADDQYHQGLYKETLATLERAIRIKPRHAEIWSRMALVYLQQQKFQQAEQHAKRSNSYIKSNSSLENFNNDLIRKALAGQQL